MRIRAQYHDLKLYTELPCKNCNICNLISKLTQENSCLDFHGSKQGIQDSIGVVAPRHMRAGQNSFDGSYRLVFEQSLSSSLHRLPCTGVHPTFCGRRLLLI